MPIPAGVKCELVKRRMKVTGPRGVLEHDIHPAITVTLGEGTATITRPSDEPKIRALHGLTRALIANMITGVTQGFEKVLNIEGVGYRAAKSGNNLTLSVGHSHPVEIAPPTGIEFAVEGTQTIKVSGIDKQAVGQAAANVRRWRPPEPYKGKGIRYANERIRRKVGKAGGK